MKQVEDESMYRDAVVLAYRYAPADAARESGGRSGRSILI